MQGPFQLKQGDVGITIRNPVYLENESGDKYFWGFTISIIRVPEIFSDSVNALEDFGYYYRLSKTLSPLTGEFTEIYSNCEEFISPVTYQFELGGCSWKLEVTPKDGWHADSQTTTVFIGGFIILFSLQVSHMHLWCFRPMESYCRTFHLLTISRDFLTAMDFRNI